MCAIGTGAHRRRKKTRLRAHTNRAAFSLRCGTGVEVHGRSTRYAGSIGATSRHVERAVAEPGALLVRGGDLRAHRLHAVRQSASWSRSCSSRSSTTCSSPISRWRSSSACAGQFTLAFASLVISPLADKYSRTLIIGIGLLILGCCNIGSAIVATAGALLVVRFIGGVGGAGNGPATFSLLADLFPPPKLPQGHGHHEHRIHGRRRTLVPGRRLSCCVRSRRRSTRCRFSARCAPGRWCS